MERRRSNVIRLFSLSIALAAFSSCFQQKEPNVELNLEKIPEHVAIVVPLLGDVIDLPIATSVGDSFDLTLTLGNAGPTAATSLQESAESTFGAPFSFKGGAYPGTGGTCTDTLEPQTMCDLVITFSPTQAGHFTQTLTIEYINGIMVFPQTIQITGHTPADLSISSPAYNFGAVATGNTAVTTLTVTNNGYFETAALQESPLAALAAPFSFLGGSFPGTGGTCDDTLPAGESCQIVLEYAPGGVGVHNDILTLSYIDGAGNPVDLTSNLSGTGF